MTVTRLRFSCALLGLLLMLGASGYYYRAVTVHGRAAAVFQAYIAGRVSNPSSTTLTRIYDAKLAMDEARLLSITVGGAGALIMVGGVVLLRENSNRDA